MIKQNIFHSKEALFFFFFVPLCLCAFVVQGFYAFCDGQECGSTFYNNRLRGDDGCTGISHPSETDFACRRSNPAQGNGCLL